MSDFSFEFVFLHAAVLHAESKLQYKNQIHAFHFQIQPTFGLDFGFAPFPCNQIETPDINWFEPEWRVWGKTLVLFQNQHAQIYPTFYYLPRLFFKY